MLRQARTLRKPLLRKNRGRLVLEMLEERNLLSCGPAGTVLEDFDDPNLPGYETLIRYWPSAAQYYGGGCEGEGGLYDYDGDDWLVRGDSALVRQGDTISAWVYLGGAASGRAYVGFGARMPNVDGGFGLVSGGTLAVVLAPNTSQFEIQELRGYKFIGTNNFGVLGTAGIGYTMDSWYRVEISWYTDRWINATLFDAAETPLASTWGQQTTARHPYTSGGLAFRGFGADAYYLFDSVVRLDGGNGPGPLSTRPPVQPSGLPAIDNYRGQEPQMAGVPAPFGYESVPGTDRDILLANISTFQQIPCSGGGCVGGAHQGNVGVRFGNLSQNLGERAVPWGPSLVGHFFNDTPLNTPQFQMYFYALDPGGETFEIGVSGMKAFWQSVWSRDLQHLAPRGIPGDQDSYAPSHNDDRRSFTSIAALNTVTGERYDYDEMGTRNVHGIYVYGRPAFTEPFQNLLKVDAYEIDPRQHPGRRYFAAANIWIPGDRNTANNSRWQELRVTPGAGQNNYTFSTTGMPAQRADVCTIPGMPQIGRCVSNGPAPRDLVVSIMDPGLVAVSVLLAQPAPEFVVPLVTSSQTPGRETAPVDQLFAAPVESEAVSIPPTGEDDDGATITGSMVEYGLIVALNPPE